MKHRLGLLAGIFLFLTLLPAFSLSFPDLLLRTFGGFTIGDAREFVYNENVVLSELEWPMSPIYFFGIGASLICKEGLELQSDVSAGIPGFTGIFKDSDFMNQSTSSEKTHYSQHDGYLEHALDVRTSLRWRFKFPSIQITPSLGYTYLLYKWTGRDGYTQYGTLNADNTYTAWNENIDKTNMYGTVISYQMEIWMPTAGLSVDILLPQNFTVGLLMEGSPLVYCNGTDNHFQRHLVFYDIMEDGYSIEPSLSLSWSPTLKTTLFLDGRSTYITALRGNTYIQTASSVILSKESMSDGSGGGASFKALSIRLGIQTRL